MLATRSFLLTSSFLGWHSLSITVTSSQPRSYVAGIAEPYAIVVIDSGDIATQWRAALDKYTKMPGIRGLHYFVFAKNSSTGDAMVRVRELCYNGPLKDSTIKVASGRLASDLVIPTPSFTYLAQGIIKDISSSKLAHLVQMYKNVIDSIRRLDFLPPSDTN